MDYTELTPVHDTAANDWRVTFEATDSDRVAIERAAPCRHALRVYADTGDGSLALIGRAATLGDADAGCPVVQINVEGLAGQSVTVASYEEITAARLIGRAKTVSSDDSGNGGGGGLVLDPSLRL